MMRSFYLPNFSSVPLNLLKLSRINRLTKDMASYDALRYDQWPSLFLYYKLDIFSLFYKGHNKSLPELLSKNIYTKR